jgi:2,4-dienoyl-CoA reductase (NADPH2)
MFTSGTRVARNYRLFRSRLLRPLVLKGWNRKRKPQIEGVNVAEAREIKRHVWIPVLCTGGFQTASVIRKVIADGSCDAVTIARPLIANPDLVKVYESGRDFPDRPCTYSNECLYQNLKSPLACYDLTRFDGDHDAMIREATEIFRPSGFEEPVSPSA